MMLRVNFSIILNMMHCLKAIKVINCLINKHLEHVMHICIIYYVLVSKEYRNEYKLAFIINNVLV